MKVKFTSEAKKYITVAEMPYVRQIIEEMKEDSNIKDYAQMAARVASKVNGSFEILKAEAEITKNDRVYDYYGEGTGTLDIWLTIYAYNAYDGFYDIGTYLTDVWQIGGDNDDEIRNHMYINEYIRR